MEAFAKRRVVAALIGTVLSLPSFALARMPADLKLRDVRTAQVRVIPQPNPHEREDACPTCHENPTRKETPGPSLVTDEFLNDAYEDYLCTECHTGWVELHPTGIEPKKSRLKVSVPTNVLPLRYVFEGRYKIVCMSCHDIHFPHTGFKLLRGYSLDPKSMPSRFNDRMDFCASCHGDQAKNLTPHRIRGRQEGCTLCHVRRPMERRTQPLRANINILCTYCHNVFPEPHYLRVNPFPELDQETIWKSGVPLRDGAYTCVTCHLPHSSADYPAFLRPEFVDLARAAIRVNPHRDGVFCQNCHVDQQLSPTNRKRPAAILTKSVAELCTRCHGAGKVTSMDHYLGLLTDKVKRPADLPLTAAGEVTCTTCHLPGCGPTSPDNPRFMRGDPSTVRSLCARCHDWTALAVRNVHAETPQVKGCEVCHEEAGRVLKDMPGGLRADQNFVCIQCHDPMPHPASYRHTTVPRQTDFVKVDSRTFPLDEYKRVTCYSCHQTHRPAQHQYLLRVDAGTGCSFCHTI